MSGQFCIGSYKNGCRCGTCKEIDQESQAAFRDKRRSQPTPVDAHGTVAGYQAWGCRCGGCRGANRERNRELVEAAVSRQRRYREEPPPPLVTDDDDQ